jgi:trk system potassium uptake protein TrkH
VTEDLREALRRVAQPVSAVVGGMALFMAACALAGFFMAAVGYARPLDAGGPEALLVSASITVLLAAVGWRFGRPELGAPPPRLSRRDATLAVALIWLGSGVFGGLPFVLGARLSPVDAFFEAISGFTTTGATIVADIEATLSRPLLLWRSIIQWLGGMGIVVLFVAIFPNVGAGGKHLFRSEVPGPTAEGLQPRITETSITLWKLYAALTALEAVVLVGLGALTPARPGVPRMDAFQAVCHALTTMSTGGFSPLNASVGAFQSPPVELAIAVFMLVGGVNYGLYYGALQGRSLRVFGRSTEFKAYVLFVVGATLLLTLGILPQHGGEPLRALRHALFAVATHITSTGYALEDPMTYPPASLTIILLLMFVGGMSGSTAGGIKVSRVVLLARTAWAQVRFTIRPSVVQVVRMSRQAVPQTVLTEVAVFFFVFMGFLAAGTFAAAFLDGASVPRAFGAMLTSLSNMGPSPFHEGPDHFAAWSDGSKLLFSGAMILGRLEFFTLLALLLPDFWRR